MNYARCRSCGDPIVWMKTRTGKNMPVNPESIAQGVVPEMAVFDSDDFESHFATCPAADKHRRKE